MASNTRVPPVKILGPICWRMLGKPPEDTSRTSGAPLASSCVGLGGGRMVASSFTRVLPVRLSGPVCWRMLGGCPADTSKTPGCPLGLLLQGVGRLVDGGLLYSGAACETLRPSVLEELGGPPADTSRTSGALLASSCRGLRGGRLVASYTRMPPVRIFNPACWRMLGGPLAVHLGPLAPPWPPPAWGWADGGWWPPILGCRL